jgi:hypothetical protein
VNVPLLSIAQIIVDDTPILINLALPQEKRASVNIEKNEGVQNSMNSFLNNPENQKLLKK